MTPFRLLPQAWQVGNEVQCAWTAAVCLGFPSCEPELQRCQAGARQESDLLLTRMGTPVALRKEDSGQGALANLGLDVEQQSCARTRIPGYDCGWD